MEKQVGFLFHLVTIKRMQPFHCFWQTLTMLCCIDSSHSWWLQPWIECRNCSLVECILQSEYCICGTRACSTSHAVQLARIWRDTVVWNFVASLWSVPPLPRPTGFFTGIFLQRHPHAEDSWSSPKKWERGRTFSSLFYSFCFDAKLILMPRFRIGRMLNFPQLYRVDSFLRFHAFDAIAFQYVPRHWASFRRDRYVHGRRQVSRCCLCAIIFLWLRFKPGGGLPEPK